MKMNEIMGVIRSLAMSQGFYGRILSRIDEIRENDPECYERLSDELESQNFRDSVDVVMFFEC